MKEEYPDVDTLEKVTFEIERDAFKPTSLHCSTCKIKMRGTELEVQIDGQIYIKINGFECSKCKKRYVGLGEAKKLDKAMIVGRALTKDFKMERNLSFDGDNYTFRIPKEFTQQVHKRKIEIVPLGAHEFCAVVE